MKKLFTLKATDNSNVEEITAETTTSKKITSKSVTKTCAIIGGSLLAASALVVGIFYAIDSNSSYRQYTKETGNLSFPSHSIKSNISYSEPQSSSESEALYSYDCIDGITSSAINNKSAVTSPSFMVGEPHVVEDKKVIPETDFIKTATEPLSTFSADVDTASYIQFRQCVNEGYPIDYMKGNNFRTEEFLNYFNYEYTEPTSGEMFGIKTEVGACPWNKDSSLVRVAVKAKEAPMKDMPLNLVFLIDSSGSMNSEDKIVLLKQTLTGMLNKLDKDDTISIVTYSGESKVVLAGANGSETAKIKRAISSINAEGATNGGVGIQAAYKLAAKYYSKEANNRIMIATDGDLNMGITSTEELEKLVSAKRKSGIYLSVLGFGHDGYNDEILETIADKGNGNYTIIDSLKQAKKTLVDEFYCTMNTVATDVKFQVAFDKTMIDSYRLIGYENRALANEDFDDDTKDAGEIGSGQTVTIMYEIKTNKVASLKNAMTLNIRYKDSVNAKSQKVSHPIDCTKASVTSADFNFTSAIASLCMVLNDSKFAGNMDIKTVSAMLDKIETSDEEKVEFKKLVKSTITSTYNSNEIEDGYDLITKYNIRNSPNVMN